MNRPRLFVSAVSAELKTARQAVANTVRTLGFDSVTQDDFPTGHGELREWLRSQIDSCEGLIQLVGHAYGAEPEDTDPEYGRVSYTQFEFLYACRRGKKTWLIIAGDNCHRDHSLNRIDLPSEGIEIEPLSYQAERRKLQDDYIARLRSDNHLRHHVGSDTELDNVVLRLRDDLDELRRGSQRQQRRLAAAIVAIILGLVVLGGGGWWAYHRLQRDVQQTGVVDAERIRAHLRRAIEETHRRELAESEKVPDWAQRQNLRNAADTEHKSRISRIEELASAFTEIDARGIATSALKELSRILNEQGVDEALAYADSQRTSILEVVKARAGAHQERNRAELEPLLHAASLYGTKGDSAKARPLYAEVLAIEPAWPKALHAACQFHLDQGDAARIRRTLEEAQREYDEARRLAALLTSADASSSEWQADAASASCGLGVVATGQGKLDGATQALAKSLDITNKLALSDPTNTRWQRRLSWIYARLGDVAREEAAREGYPSVPQSDRTDPLSHLLGDPAVARERLGEAARTYRQSVEICKALVGSEPSNDQWQQELLWAYCGIGDVALAQGNSQEARKAYEDSFAIAMKLARAAPTNHELQRDLSLSYGRLGDAAMAERAHDEAARAYAERLDIATKLTMADPTSPEFQRDLRWSFTLVGNAAMAQGRLENAAKAYLHSSEIAASRSHGDPSNTAWQRELSESLAQLGDVAMAQNKMEEAFRAYTQSSTIAKALVAADSTNVQWQRDLALSHVRLFGVAAAQGKNEEGLAALQQVFEVMGRLAANDPSTVTWRRHLSAVFTSLLGAGQMQRSRAAEAAQATTRGAHGDAARAYRQSLQFAARCAEGLAALDPTNTQFQQDLSASYATLGDTANAHGMLQEAVEAYARRLEVLTKLLASDSSNTSLADGVASAHNTLGVVLLAQNKIDEARQIFERSVEIASPLAESDLSNAQWHTTLGWAYSGVGDVAMSDGRLEAAARAYRQRCDIVTRLNTLDPTNTLVQDHLAWSHDGLGRVALAQNNHEEAARAFGKFAAIAAGLTANDPSSTSAQRGVSVSYERLGNLALARGRIDEAVRSYRRFAEVASRLSAQDPTNAEFLHDVSVSYASLGRVALAEGRLEEAKRAYDQRLDVAAKLVSTDPHNSRWRNDLSWSHTWVGVMAEKRGEVQAAVASFREAVRVDPSVAEAHFRLGHALADQGIVEDAITAYRQAVRLNPESAQAHYSLGIALGNKGLTEASVVEYREAIRIEPTFPEAYCNLGLALGSLGRFRQARNALQQGHDLGSKQIDWDYPSEEWLEEAEALVAHEDQFERHLANRTDPSAATELAQLASIALLKGRPETAARWYRAAFDREAPVGGDLSGNGRLSAARAALRAARSDGETRPAVGQSTSAEWRTQARLWLEQDLEHLQRRLEADEIELEDVQRVMDRWLRDPDLAGTREPVEIKKLSTDEQAPWRTLWQRVEALRITKQ